MKKFGIILFLVTSTLFATTKCYDFDDYINYSNDLVEIKKIIEQTAKQDEYDRCISKGGEGSIFHMGASIVRKGKCGDKSGSINGYLEIPFTCSYCDGDKLKSKLKKIEEECNNRCLSNIAYCQKPDMVNDGGWGGYIEDGDKCGPFDSTLPGCIESSSSESPESSSSEKISSSSESIKSSSSEAESSSSEEDVESSSSEEEIDSSSSEDDDGSSSSEESSSSFDVFMDHCEIGGDKRESLERLGYVHTDIYSGHPYLANSDNVFVWGCYCMGTNYVACDFYNFGLVEGYTPIEMSICGYPEGYWCEGIENGSCDYGGRSVRLYYTDLFGPGEVAWSALVFGETGMIMQMEYSSMRVILRETKNGVTLASDLFSMRHLLPTNVSYQDLENLVHEAIPQIPDMNKYVAYCRGEWVPHDEECFGTLDEVNMALLDSSDNCAIAYGIPHYEISYSDRGWCVDGACEPAEPYSSMVEESSSSVEESSSSAEESSSSEISSSSEDVVDSSSSLSVAEPFVAGADQEYSPDQIFNSGLQNMEPGACYSLNPERGVQHGWINTNAQDTYWWRESDCYTGEKIDRKRIGQCPGSPIGHTPEHPDRTCFAHNGKCYRCMVEKSYVDCTQEWVWKWDFNPDLVNDWYTEVDCNNPTFGKPPLYKKAGEFDEPVENAGYTVDFQPARVFDVMGRQNSTRDALRDRRALYKKH